MHGIRQDFDHQAAEDHRTRGRSGLDAGRTLIDAAPRGGRRSAPRSRTGAAGELGRPRSSQLRQAGSTSRAYAAHPAAPRRPWPPRPSRRDRRPTRRRRRRTGPRAPRRRPRAGACARRGRPRPPAAIDDQRRQSGPGGADEDRAQVRDALRGADAARVADHRGVVDPDRRHQPSSQPGARRATSRAQRAATSAPVSPRTPRLSTVTGCGPAAATRPTQPRCAGSPTPGT